MGNNVRGIFRPADWRPDVNAPIIFDDKQENDMTNENNDVAGADATYVEPLINIDLAAEGGDTTALTQLVNQIEADIETEGEPVDPVAEVDFDSMGAGEYIGTKQLRAAAMNLGDYNLARGWMIPDNKDPRTKGYIVQYPDGYVSWSPKRQFDLAYKPVDALTFGIAVESAKRGFKIARAGWNGKGMFVFFVPGSTFEVSRAPLLGIYPKGTEINYHGHLDMRTADGMVVPWLASQTDVLAEDWYIVE